MMLPFLIAMAAIFGMTLFMVVPWGYLPGMLSRLWHRILSKITLPF